MKRKILKIIYFLSFIPYLLMIFSIIFRKYVIGDVELHGIERFWETIKYFFLEDIFYPIIPTCLTFQMCYIFRNNDKIMFKCSFIPYIFLLLFGVKSAIFGASFIGDKLYYGFEGYYIGVFSTGVYYTIVFPILPIYLIFQIAFIIVKRKSRKKQLDNINN